MRPLGLNYHVVKNPCNDQEYTVGDATGGMTFTPGSAVALGSFTGNPGEFIMGKPPAGFGGASGYSVAAARRGYDITLPGDPPPPPPAMVLSGLGFVDNGVSGVSVLKFDESYAYQGVLSTLTTPDAWFNNEGAFIGSAPYYYLMTDVNSSTAAILWNLTTGAAIATLDWGSYAAYDQRRAGPPWAYSGTFYWLEWANETIGDYKNHVRLRSLTPGGTVQELASEYQAFTNFTNGFYDSINGARGVFSDRVRFHVADSVGWDLELTTGGSANHLSYDVTSPATGTSFDFPISTSLSYHRYSSNRKGRLTRTGDDYTDEYSGGTMSNAGMTMDEARTMVLWTQRNQTGGSISAFPNDGSLYTGTEVVFSTTGASYDVFHLIEWFTPPA